MKTVPHSRPQIGPKEKNAVLKVLAGGHLASGPKARELEKAAAKKLGLKYGAAVSSGLSALTLALRAARLPDNAQVLMPSYVCSALWHAAKLAGLEPLICDTDPATFNIDFSDARKRLTRRTKAIIVPHMFGLAQTLPEWTGELFTIEDLAMSFGARADEKMAGTFGDAAVTSFYATKLMAAGEGGLILSGSRAIVDGAADLREYDGKIPDMVRQNAKLSDLHAAIALAQLKRLDSFIAARDAIAHRYDNAFGNLPATIIPARQPGRIYFRYVLKLRKMTPGHAISRLERRGIAARMPVFHPLHLDCRSSGKFPGAEEAYASALSIPLYSSLTEKETGQVIKAVIETLSRQA